MEIKFLDAKAKIIVDKLAQRKMELVVDLCHTEVGWLCLVKREGPLQFRVMDLFLVDQGVHATTTELDPDAVARLNRQMWTDKIITMENQHEVGLYLWGHSHVNMGVFASGQDDTQFKTLYGAEPPFYIRVIANKKGEISTDVFVKDSVLGKIILSKVDWVVDAAENDELRAVLKKELAEKVRPLHTYTGAPGTHYRKDPLPYDPKDYSNPKYPDHRSRRGGYDDEHDYWEEVYGAGARGAYPDMRRVGEPYSPPACGTNPPYTPTIPDLQGKKIISTVGKRGVGEVTRVRRQNHVKKQ